MRKEYKEQLEKLKVRMEKAEAFAKKVPMFKEKILEEKLTGEEQWVKYLDHLKHVKTFNGVQRGFFDPSTNRRITNCNKKYKGYYWTLYINTLCEYNSHAKYGLNEICENIPVYFYDSLNSTFYCTDEELPALLEAIDKWGMAARSQAERDSLGERVKKAEEEAKKAAEKVARLKESL